MDFKVYLLSDSKKRDVLEVRRSQISEYDVSTAASTQTLFPFFVQKIAEITPMLAGKIFQIYWKDADNDYVSISTESEMSWALSKMIPNQERNNITRLYVTLQSKTVDSVHEKVSCDGCQISPIVGFRYKCIKCEDYDLCSSCAYAGIHSEHDMLRLTTPVSMDYRFQHFLRPRIARWVENRASAKCPIFSSSDEEQGECGKKRRHFKEEKKERHGHGRRHCRTNIADVINPFGDLAAAAVSAAATSASAATALASDPVNVQYLKNIGRAVANLLDPLGIDVAVDVRPKEGEKTETKQANTTTTEPGKTSTEQPAPQTTPFPGMPLHDPNTLATAIQHITDIFSQQRVCEPGWAVIDNNGQSTPVQQSMKQGEPQPQAMYPDLTPPTPATASAPAAPVDRASEYTHANPLVQQGFRTLSGMGFSDENGVLTRLLEIHNGDIYKVLDTYAALKK